MTSAPRQTLRCIVTLLLLATAGQGWAKEKSVGVLISREIVPYVSMVEGLESRIHDPLQRFFLDDEGKPYSLGGRNATLNPQVFDVLVAVGPEALHYLKTQSGTTPLVYGMVLNPDNVVNDPQKMPCGVSLNIPAAAQFSSILQHIPDLKRLGVLFDPGNNQAWFQNAAAVATDRGFDLVPLQVSRQGGRLKMVGEFSRLDAILFIPDKSIISKAVIQYVIKQGVINNTPVIGYNQFFADSGAAFNFLIDYQGVGRQVAKQVELLLAGEKCEEAVSSKYEAVINEEVWQSMMKKRSED